MLNDVEFLKEMVESLVELMVKKGMITEKEFNDIVYKRLKKTKDSTKFEHLWK